MVSWKVTGRKSCYGLKTKLDILESVTKGQDVINKTTAVHASDDKPINDRSTINRNLGLYKNLSLVYCRTNLH